LKQSQREALTKEKQSRLATGGGSQETEANVDPDIVNIAPHLMQTAPTLFTSNMTEAEINGMYEIYYKFLKILLIFGMHFREEGNCIRNIIST